MNKEQETEVMQTPEPRTSGGASALSELRKKREAIGQERRLKLEIPGYDGELVAVYKPIEWDRLKKVADKAEKSGAHRKELNAQADTIALACVTILGRKEGTDEMVPMHELYPAEFGDSPAVYDSRLAKALGFEADTARQCVLRLFNNDLAVTAHQNELGEWMQSSRIEDDESF